MDQTATSASILKGPLAFLDRVGKSTQKSYRSFLKRYLSHFYGQVEDLEAAVARYLRERREMVRFACHACWFIPIFEKRANLLKQITVIP